MGTITAETAHRIWSAHHEITSAEKLLGDMRDFTGRLKPVTPQDAFGRQHGRYQFGVPSGESGHRLFGVSPRLAEVVVKGHIADMRRELAEACAVAALELEEPTSSVQERSDGAGTT